MKQNNHGFVQIQWIWILLIIQTGSGQEDTQQCYSGLGCFPNDYPWSSLERPLPPPQDPQTVGTKIYCYTRNSSVRYNITLWPNIDLNGCQFTSSRNTVFITHGFIGNGNSTWIDLLKNYYLIQDDVNIFLVDWGPGAENPYWQAAANTRIVSAEVVRFLKFLNSTFGLTADQLHMIGFSLGAHALAMINKNFSVVNRMTALDPAQPLFEGADPEVRLDKGDAKFVDVVHTSAYPFIPFGGFGYIQPCGHVDFYMNRGRNQPGCPLPSNLPAITSINDLESFTSLILKQVVFCSHARSFMYFLYAVGGNCTFVGRKTTYEQIASPFPGRIKPVQMCTPETCTVLGLKTPLYPARGVFETETGSSPPYCKSGSVLPFVL